MVAVSLFAILLIPILTGFGTGVQHTQVIRSRLTARGLAEKAVAEARAFIQAGGYDGACGSLGSPVPLFTGAGASEYAEALAQLQDLKATITVSCLSDAKGTPDHSLFEILVEMSWKDPGIAQRRSVRIRTVEGEEI